MKNKIRILPDPIANQIAAGEVVQRPESVVKELLENAIDAGANEISIVIKDAGRTLIQVIDNGSGMTSEDARLACERHATSKIYTTEDLMAIHTLGFRGEALASIASVSRLELKTRTDEDKVGVQLVVDGGKFLSEEPVGCQTGTSISVKNLFYNVPGRRKFLKSDNVEFRHMVDTVQKYAMLYHDIKFTFFSDEQSVLELEPTDFTQRIGQIFGKKVKEKLIPISEKTDLINIEGVISHPDVAKKSRGDQYLFINGRAIVHKSLQHAIFQAYQPVIQHGTYPFYVLILSIDPKRVDINVHPQKLEVKFDDERSIYAITLAVMRKALSQNDLTPSFDGGMTHVNGGSDWQFDPQSGFKEFRKPSDRPSSPISNFPYRNPVDRIPSLPFTNEVISTASKTGQPAPAVTVLRAHGTPQEILTSFTNEVDNSAIGDRRIWQVHNKFVFSQIVTGLMIIDQHVAHERILYEDALRMMETNSSFSQQLLFPYTLELSAADFELMKSIKTDIINLGFNIKFYSGKTVVVEGVPIDVKKGAEQRILQEIINQYREYETDLKWKGRQNLAASFACRSAIKAGDPLTIPEMNNLIDRLFACTNPYTCPHGRPIVIKMTIDDLDQKFGRKHP